MVVKQKGPLTYLVKVRETQVWKWHIDHLRQIEALLKSNDKSPMKENEFANSETDDDFIDNATASEPIVVDARRYPQNTCLPPDRLIYQDSIWLVRVL